ncbi:hypothetical protein NF347_08760 [Paramuribaculum intestinale]|uniref:hypothetical protein n=1 Tax=Paramuribaculum intestinale TaxID=2094151 RepID=UPI000D1FAF9C|nr:hypothetical protein [Paramuribaculum intestinale]PWB09623.1 hypothetical protein C5O24_07000 [Paramuribaculum intestinale]ROS85163.1 hypothetical protein EEK90_03195 [Muribaculaceae bacterium Isolate-036 (Harlan)]WLT41076.1 hypothetical protein NF347_08760 [Paramuribaculum intestinale]
MILKLKYIGVNDWSYRVYEDQNGRRYGNIELEDSNDISAIYLLTADYEEPLCPITDCKDLEAVEITHRDGSVNTITIPNK